ncbi:MAG: fructose-bisphosphate aldolase class I [Actinomycetota bacterium]|nr:fructose-bisphosphate aldolase class I [Actinomycetota bacterium]
MVESPLKEVAQALMAPAKGILAADESLPTIEKRFGGIGLPSTEENRRSYRQMLFTTPGLEQFISGVILFDETIRQRADTGVPFPDFLQERGIVPGIKVDKGAKPLAGFPGEKVTEGLDGLRERLAEYRRLGAGFTKWRAVVSIGEDIPTHFCLEANAHALARFAALSQEARLVPVVEPEVLMDGDHGLDRCYQVTSRMLERLFDRLFEHRVRLETTLLKTNMVLAGKQNSRQASIEEVAEATVRCLREVVPPALPGIVFLSGGQSPEAATERLNAMNAIGSHPWQLGFSYARALQGPALEAWRGRQENVEAAQTALRHRARCNSAARSGNYSKEMEEAA